MPTDFPGAVDDFTNPTASDSQADVSHSSQHANLNDAVEAIETALVGLGIDTGVGGTTRLPAASIVVVGGSPVTITTDGADHLIPFNDKDFDNRSFWDSGDPAKLTIPGDPDGPDYGNEGVYIVNAVVQYKDDPTTPGMRAISIFKNGSYEVSASVPSVSASGFATTVTLSYVCYLLQGDVIELYGSAVVGSGGPGALNIYGSTNILPRLSIVRLG